MEKTKKKKPRGKSRWVTTARWKEPKKNRSVSRQQSYFGTRKTG